MGSIKLLPRDYWFIFIMLHYTRWVNDYTCHISNENKIMWLWLLNNCVSSGHLSHCCLSTQVPHISCIHIYEKYVIRHNHIIMCVHVVFAILAKLRPKQSRDQRSFLLIKKGQFITDCEYLCKCMVWQNCICTKGECVWFKKHLMVK